MSRFLFIRRNKKKVKIKRGDTEKERENKAINILYSILRIVVFIVQCWGMQLRTDRVVRAEWRNFLRCNDSISMCIHSFAARNSSIERITHAHHVLPWFYTRAQYRSIGMWVYSEMHCQRTNKQTKWQCRKIWIINVSWNYWHRKLCVILQIQTNSNGGMHFSFAYFSF